MRYSNAVSVAVERYLLLALGAVSLLGLLAWAAHFASYRFIKRKTLHERRWDYNICCGTTDGGGLNADIVRHAEVPRFELVEDVTRLPHPDKSFEHVLCSHTIEHVPDPAAMFTELRRVGRNVTILVPPLWDFTAALNPFEHQVIFLTLRSRHDNRLPRYVRFAPARWIQAVTGQKINADMLEQPRHGRAGSPNPPGTAPSAKAPYLLDISVPLFFAAAAALAFAGSAISGALFFLGLASLWASKR